MLVVAAVKVTCVLEVDSPKLKSPILTAEGPVFVKVRSKLSPLEPALAVTDSAVTIRLARAAR